MEKSARPFTMMAILALAVCTVASNFSAAKEKKSTLPAYVLEAQTDLRSEQWILPQL
jgi:hypothetical protein